MLLPRCRHMLAATYAAAASTSTYADACFDIIMLRSYLLLMLLPMRCYAAVHAAIAAVTLDVFDEAFAFLLPATFRHCHCRCRCHTPYATLLIRPV